MFAFSSWLRCPRRPIYSSLVRSLSSSAIPEHSIYISESTNPYFNLTFEDWLFRHKPAHQPLLLLYRDDPCVVIGRNQNPWKEVNFKALRSRSNVPFIRRRSGGGTVYHDLGNTNFSIHLPRTSFDRHATAQIVLRALDTLGDLLRTEKESMETRGVASVRSPVCNLRQFSPDISHNTFVDAVVKEFRKEYDVSEDAQTVREGEMRGLDYIERGMAELPSWEWAYGQTPEFTYSVQNKSVWGNTTAQFRSKHGLILECNIHVPNDYLTPEDVRQVQQLLVGERYGSIPEGAREEMSMNSRTSELWKWLNDVMNN
ncbi:hypothetical protein PM082_005964 [Marasmius tenuissimus]|nr:hypothetical protein PM082_005964 [Marasmius tenuissimus]